MAAALVLNTVATSDALRVSIANPGVEPVRIWSRGCSWGWDAYSLLVRVAGAAVAPVELLATPIRWTVNFPRAREIPPGDRAEVVLRAGDPDWLGVPDPAAWRGVTLDLVARLRIPPTPEAAEYGVFVGDVLSPPFVAAPPHRWLLPPDRHRPRTATHDR